MTRPCDCCAGSHPSGPFRVRNRPGLDRLETRIGTHHSFLASMLSRLSAADYPRLADLRARTADDPAIAWLDVWAVVADVLTFYQERIANEGYLRTATERRSLVELARLIGYRPRPGVAASTYLSFELENEAPPAQIPAGTRVNSIPAPGETMVAFETGETIEARREWSAIRPRQVRPQTIKALLPDGPGLYLKGTETKLKLGSCLVIDSGQGPLRIGFVYSVTVDHANDRTLVRLDPPPPPSFDDDDERRNPLERLLRPPTIPPRSAAALTRSVEASFAPGSDTLPRLLATMQPILRGKLYDAIRNAPPENPQRIRVYAMRIEARPFGHNAPLRLDHVDQQSGRPVMEEWQIDDPTNRPPSTDWGSGTFNTVSTLPPAAPATLPTTPSSQIHLDNDYEVAPDSMFVIVKESRAGVPATRPMLIERAEYMHVSRSAYGLTGKSLLVRWDPDSYGHWLTATDNFSTIRTTRVFGGSEELELADSPVVEPVRGDKIELDGLYEGLEPGRWLIVEGERADIVSDDGQIFRGVRGAELVMLAAVEHKVSRPFENAAPTPGDTLHTFITLAGRIPDDAPGSEVEIDHARRDVAKPTTGLSYRYRRGTVIIHANVAPATHGETRTEVLGSGDAAAPLQQFELKQPPLTYVSAANASGVESTLQVRVNDVLWHEARALAGLGPTDRKYVTWEKDDGKTTVQFGNGIEGARLPTGRENVRSVYRTGIGRAGNVAAGQLSLLATRPLGVKGAINPIRASGGADRESAASIRRLAPTALLALDRLVSTSDYADFARGFAGIGKASATRSTNGRRRTVNVVVAGADDIPIDRSSDLFNNLLDALHRHGDSQVVVELAVRRLLTLVVKAGVGIGADYQWALVEPRIRAAMLEEFGFERIEIGEWLPVGRVLRTIQSVEGVVYVDVDIFDRLSEAQVVEGFEDDLAETLAYNDLIRVDPDQIAYLTPDVPGTLILQELKS